MKSTDPRFPLSKSFTLTEFIESNTATRLGIDNTPTNDIVVRLNRLCDNVLQPVRDKFGPIRISSGYRCPKLNRAVGGSNSSQHMVGEAADIIPLAASKREVYEYIKRHLPFDQLIWEFGTSIEPAWVHVSFTGSSPNRKQAFRIS